MLTKEQLITIEGLVDGQWVVVEMGQVEAGDIVRFTDHMGPRLGPNGERQMTAAGQAVLSGTWLSNNSQDIPRLN